jgi:hypothetical protein
MTRECPRHFEKRIIDQCLSGCRINGKAELGIDPEVYLTLMVAIDYLPGALITIE